MSAAANTELTAHPRSPALPTFFDNLDSFAEAPEGVAKLRAFVLDLAVRGKLVEQDENEEPASELVNRAAEQRAQPANGKKVSSSKTLPSVEPHEMTFDLPHNWAWVRMSHIADHRLGKMLDKGKNKGKPYPYLRNTNVQWLEFDLDDIKEMRFEDDELKEYEVRKGDLLVCEGGEPGRCAIWQGQTERMMFQKAIHRVRPLAGIDAWFLQYVLLADARSGNLDHHFTGATIKHFTGRELARYVVPLPPLSEQRRIVSKVNGLMSLCDELESRSQQRVRLRERASRSCLDSLVSFRSRRDLASAWQRLADHFEVLYDTPETLAQLRQSILQLAVQGKLVPQDPNDEPASELSLKDVLREDTLNGYGKRPSNEPTGVPILRISAGTGRDDFVVDETDHKWANVTERELEKFNLQPGDLLACRFNGNLHFVGRFSMYTASSGERQIFPDKLIRFRVDESRVDPAYVRYAMNAAQTRQKIEAFCATTAGNIGISATNLKTVTLPVPPLAEQKRIVAKVDQLLSQCDELSARLRDRQSATHGLLTATIHQLLNDAQSRNA